MTDKIIINILVALGLTKTDAFMTLFFNFYLSVYFEVSPQDLYRTNNNYFRFFHTKMHQRQTHARKSN